MALGAAILHQNTPASERCGSKDYPAIADRVHALVSRIGPEPNCPIPTTVRSLHVCSSGYTENMRALPMAVHSGKVFTEELVEGLR